MYRGRIGSEMKGETMNRFYKARHLALVLTTIFLAVILMSAVYGCGGNTPSSAARDMVQMLSDRQFGEAYDSFSSVSPVREIKREDFISQMEASLPDGTTITEFSVTEEKIDGDKATINWKAKVNIPNAEEQPLDDSFSAVKEDGTWKIEQ